MQKLSKIHLTLIGAALALAGCDNVGGSPENSQVRQNKLTISNTPVFPHSGNGDVYALLLSNHTDQELKLGSLKLNELNSVGQDENASELKDTLNKAQLAKANQINELVDLSACQSIAANSNCIVTVKLPKSVASGYFDFSLNYSDSHDKSYKVDKLIVFNAEMTPTDGLIITSQHLESMVVNSDKYTVAIPFQLTDDFESINIRQHGVNPSGYNQIICNNSSDNEDIKSQSYAHNSNCTALIELNGHEVKPELSLATTDTNGLERFVEIKSNVLYGNYPELVAIGAPLIMPPSGSGSIYIKNIGTQTAKDIQTSQTGDTSVFTVFNSSCKGRALENTNGQCFMQYQQVSGNKQDTATLMQTVTYKGDDGLDTRMFSTKYAVHLNKVASLRAPNQNNTSVSPAHRAIDSQREYFPEDLRNITATFDQPINASGLYQNDGGMGVLIGAGTGATFSGCEGYTYLTPGSIVCKLSAFHLTMLASEVTFEMRTGQLGNSTGVIQNASQASQREFKYVVRHHRNPSVSYVTSTSQTFKPGDSIKLKVTLETSIYNTMARYRFNAAPGYIITNSTSCRTTNTTNCTMDVEYKIPAAAQLTGSGTIQHTLPQKILDIVPSTSGSKTSTLTVSHNLTLSVSKLPAVHITVPELTRDFLQGYICATDGYKITTNFCYFGGLHKYNSSDYAKNYTWVIRSYNRFNGSSSVGNIIGYDNVNFIIALASLDNHWLGWTGNRDLFSLNNRPTPSEGRIDSGVSNIDNIITYNDPPIATLWGSRGNVPYYLLLIPNGYSIRDNPPGTIYVGRFCARQGHNSASSRYCSHLPLEQ